MTERHPGSRFVYVEDPASAQPFRTWVVYPTTVAPRAMTVGPYRVDVAPEAPIDGTSLPVVLVSHGTGSSPFLFRELALRLAVSGYLVALVEHPGNHRDDDSRADTDANLLHRPRHLRLALDALARDELLGARIATERVAVLGHSLGGYTALAAAGGTPWTRTGERLDVERDGRVAALVLLNPATFWFVPEGSLRAVAAPILIFTGEEDGLCPPWHGELIAWTVADRSKVRHRRVPKAGHLSLLSEPPPSSPWRDPPGFDRAAVHAMLSLEIAAFLEQTLRS